MKPSEHKAQIMATLIGGLLARRLSFHIEKTIVDAAEEGYALIMARCQTLPAPADTEDSNAQA